MAADGGVGSAIAHWAKRNARALELLTSLDTAYLLVEAVGMDARSPVPAEHQACIPDHVSPNLTRPKATLTGRRESSFETERERRSWASTRLTSQTHSADM
jgi:hypothetical protein